MMDKVQKIREEVERLKKETSIGLSEHENGVEQGRMEILNAISIFLDSMQEEPVSNPTPSEKMSVERWKKACEAACCEINFRSHFGLTETRDDYFVDGVQWADEHPKEEPVSEDLGNYINELSKQFTEVSFAKLSRIAVRVAKWQKEHLWKPADGDDLPEIDREVIALLDNGKVVFAHRPPEYWDGKDIVTGKVTRNYPKTYDKGGWNSPNIKWWLDFELPCGGRKISMNYTDKNKE